MRQQSFMSWAPDPLRPWLGNHILFSQEVSVNVDWHRSSIDMLDLEHKFSDFFSEDILDTLALGQQANAPVNRTRVLSQSLTILHQADGAGVNITPHTELVPLKNTQGSNVSIGQVVYSHSSGSFRLALSSNLSQSRVIGLVADPSIPNMNIGFVQTTGVLTADEDQWDVVTGQTGGLSPSVSYYLDNAIPGKLSNLTPDSLGNNIVLLGIALTSRSFLIAPKMIVAL